MKRSGYIQRTKAAYLSAFRDGEREGQQQVIDAIMVWLHRQGWGTTRILRMWEGIHAVLDEHTDAYHVGMEQDIAQERMDAELRDALRERPELFCPFAERHPQVLVTGYDKAPKERAR